MAEKNIKISGIGDVTREDFVRAITDPDKFREFADLQGWGNKRRLLAWNSLHNYALGVLNGEINEINDMHQVVDDTGARTNKKEKYNLIGSKFDANGATAAFMNLIAKGMSSATKSEDKTLKSIPSVTSYLNLQWFGSNNPDWALFQKNDTLSNGVYSIANRSAKLKEGLLSLKNELTTNGAQYNWDGVDKEALYKKLDTAINSPNIATYAPLGITSDFINNALATKDLSTTATNATENLELLANSNPTSGLTEEELALYNTMTPELLQQYLALKLQYTVLINEETLAKRLAAIDAALKNKEDAAFTNWLKINGHYSPKALFTSTVSERLLPSNSVRGGAVKNLREFANAMDKNKFTPEEWSNFIVKDLTSDISNIYALKNADRKTTNGTVAIKSKLDWLNYNFNLLAANGDLDSIGDDVSSYVGASKGTVYRLKNSKRASDGTYMYMRKKGNNLEFYRSKSWNDLRNDEYKKHISKHLFGGDLSARYRSYAKDLEARQDAVKSLKKIQSANLVERTPIQSTRTSDRVKAGLRELGNLGQMTSSDWALLGGITADIASTAASFFGPAGNVVGAGLGLAGTGAHAYADFNDPSVSTGEAFTNLGVNLLYDAAGAVPILGSYGKLAKLGRVGKVLQNNARLYKIILGSVSAPGVLQAAPNAANAVKKLVTNPSSITADELRDLSTAVSVIAGLTKIGPNHNQARTNNRKFGLTVTVHTTRGKKTIPVRQYEAMMDKSKNPTMRDRNEALEAATKVKGILFDNGIFHNYAPSSWNPLNFEGFYGKFGVVSRLGNASDPETRYRFRPAGVWERYNLMKNSKPQNTLTNGTSTTKKTIKLQKKDGQELRDLRTLNRDFKTLDLINAERRDALAKSIAERKSLEADIARGRADLKNALMNTWRRNNLSEFIRNETNKLFAINWNYIKPKAELRGTAREKKLAMYERLFPPITESSKKTTKSRKKKTTNKNQNGGVLYNYDFLNSVHAFKLGGIIKAKDGIKTNNNIWAGNNLDYGYSTFLNRIFGDNDVLSWMRTHYNGNNATKAYADYVMKNVNDRSTYGINNYNNSSTYTANQGITTFNTGYLNNGDTLNYTLFGNNTDNYTNKKGVAYNLINFTRPNNAMHTGDSYNSDSSKAYIDNALGLLTYSRVASLTDSNIKSGGFGDWGKYWKEQGNTGAYYYIAPNDTSGKGLWIPTSDKTLNGYLDFETASLTTPKEGSKTTPDIGKKSIFSNVLNYLSKLTSNPGNLYNAVETGKYLLANKDTNDIFKIKALNYTISPKHTSYQVMDNLALLNAYHSKAAETLNQTSRPITSSGLLQTAARQESMNNANKLFLQGNAERNTWLEGLKQLTYKAGMYNMESAVDTANANALLAYNTRMINEYKDPRDRIRGLATNRQNWINALEKFNIIDPYVERKNAQLLYGLAKAQWDYLNDSDLVKARLDYLNMFTKHLNDINFNPQTTPEFLRLTDMQKAATAKYYNNMYQIYGIKNPGFTFKKGGKFEDISKFNTKEFYNTIRHSINTATKQGGDLGKLINTLFKKSNKK